MENIEDLREQLIEVFKQTKAGRMDTDQAKILVTTANAILQSAALELEHNKFTLETEKIPFLTAKPKELKQ